MAKRQITKMTATAAQEYWLPNILDNSCQRDVFPAPRSVVIPVVQAYGSGRSVQRSLDGIMIFVLEEDGVKTPPSLTMPLGCEPYRFAKSFVNSAPMKKI